MPTKDTGVISARVPLQMKEGLVEYARVRRVSASEIIIRAVGQLLQGDSFRAERDRHFGDRRKKRRY